MTMLRWPTKAAVMGSVALLIAACTSDPDATSGGADDQEPITLQLLAGWEEGNVFNGPLDILIPELEERSDGLLQIEVTGPEAVPFSEQIDAVGNRVYDILYNVPLYHSGQVPEGELIYFISSESSCAEYREAGALDIYDEVHRSKANVMFLGCGGGGAHGATFVTAEPLETLDDFNGLRFRGFGAYNRVLEELGASSVAMPPPDIYNAIERGVVDGAAFPNLGIIQYALHEVAPYIVLPPYLPFRYAFYMNPDSYEQLPGEVQDLLTETVWDLEPEFDAYWAEQRDAEHEELLELGVTPVELPAGESEQLKQLVFDGMWDFIEENSPEFGPRLREAFEAVEDR